MYRKFSYVSLSLLISLLHFLLPGARISGFGKVDPERHDVLGQVDLGLGIVAGKVERAAN